MFTRAYRYAIPVLHTGMQYRYAVHVSSLFTRANMYAQYRYRIHVSHTCAQFVYTCVLVRNTGMQYMLQLCLHVRTGAQYRYCIPVCNTGIAHRCARVNIVLIVIVAP